MKYFVIAGTVLFMFLTTQSCVSDLVLDNSDFKSKLVINCLFNPEEVFSVQVTNSRNILDLESQIGAIEDAVVIIRNELDKSEEILIETKPGHYSSNILMPIAGNKYTIEVEAEGFSSVYASSRIPAFQNNFVIDTSVIEVEGQSIFKVDITFDDLEGAGNYYVWEMELLQGDNRFLSGIGTTDAHTERVSPLNSKQTRIFLSDSSFDGESYSTSFFSSEAVNSSETTTSEVRLFNVSENMYKYYKTLELYENLNSNSNTNLSPPVAVYSNIEGGLGIFAGFNLSTYQFEIL